MRTVKGGCSRPRPAWGRALAPAATGAEAWSYTTPDSVGGLALGADGTVYASSWGSGEVAIGFDRTLVVAGGPLFAIGP